MDLFFLHKNCEYCGKNPVPHFVFWYFESINILLAPIRRKLLGLFSQSFGLSKIFVSLGKFFGVLGVQKSREKCKVKRAKVLWEEAERRGIVMEELLLFGNPFDVYTAEKIQNSKSKSQIVFSGLPRPENTNKAALDFMDDKALLKEKFKKNALPIPRGGSVWNFSQATKIFEDLQKLKTPVIVKPRAGSRGRHSTTFITNKNGLKQAYKIAKQLCFWVMVEEHLVGPVYRATVINYELCGVLKGEQPKVLGDGVLSVRELIKKKNSQRKAEVGEIEIGDAVKNFVLKSLPEIQNNFWEYVPKMGEEILLSEKIGVAYGGSSAEEINICHVDNKELFLKAARVVGDSIVGFDFIIPDITKSWKNQRCGFLEANSLPFINLHHEPLNGPSQNVAAKVWEMIEMK